MWEWRDGSTLLTAAHLCPFLIAVPAHSGPGPLTQFRNHLFTAGRTPWTSDQPVARPLPTDRTTQTQHKHIPNMRVLLGFESMISASERAKTLRALDRTATVTGSLLLYLLGNRPRCRLDKRLGGLQSRIRRYGEYL
jgi:hypothetical protein